MLIVFQVVIGLLIWQALAVLAKKWRVKYQARQLAKAKNLQERRDKYLYSISSMEAYYVGEVAQWIGLIIRNGRLRGFYGLEKKSSPRALGYFFCSFLYACFNHKGWKIPSNSDYDVASWLHKIYTQEERQEFLTGMTAHREIQQKIRFQLERLDETLKKGAKNMENHEVNWIKKAWAI